MSLYSVKKYLAARAFGIANSASFSGFHVFNALIQFPMVRQCECPNRLARLTWCSIMG